MGPNLSPTKRSDASLHAGGFKKSKGSKIYVEGIKVSPSSKRKLNADQITDMINEMTGVEQPHIVR